MARGWRGAPQPGMEAVGSGGRAEIGEAESWGGGAEIVSGTVGLQGAKPGPGVTEPWELL